MSCTALPRETVTANNPPSRAGSFSTYGINGEKYRITSHLSQIIILDATPNFEKSFSGKQG